MPLLRLSIQISLAMAATCLVVSSEPSLPEVFDVERIDIYHEKMVAQKQLPGLTVAIIQEGELVLANGYGQSSLEDGHLVTTNTLFAIGSVTKQFACAAILLLAEDGKLSAHDSVSDYYPELTRAKEISLLDLMNHVSGYPDYYPLDYVVRPMQKPIDEDVLIRQFASGKLDFEPGTQWSYSNTGYIILGRIVERVSGEPFGEFLRTRIFDPLSLANTSYTPAPDDPRLANGYASFALGDLEPVQPEGQGWIAAAGGIYSTPTDLAKWNLALMTGKLLRPESYALMTSPRELKDGKVTTYGCGLSVRTQNGRQVLSHTGAVSGFNASSAMIPSTRSAVIMMCNAEGGLSTLPNEILNLLLKETPTVPTIDGPAAVELAKTLFLQLQSDAIERRLFSEEFNHFLTPDKVAGAAHRFKKLGAVVKAYLLALRERGGMEVSTVRLHFTSGTLRTLIYRRPDGIVAQFFVYED